MSTQPTIPLTWEQVYEKNSKADPITLTKMTVKTCGTAPGSGSLSAKPTPLCQIWGRATGLKIVANKTTGEQHVAITGNFEAENIQPGTDTYGQRYGAGRLFLPSGIQDIIEAPLMAAEKAEQSIALDFAFELYSVKATNPIGYSYQAVNLIPPAETDELSGIRRMMAERKQKLLEAGKPQNLVEAPKSQGGTAKKLA